MDLQELISRGRFLFSGANERLDVFRLVNGRRSAKDIAKETKRNLNSILNDLKKISRKELIIPKKDKDSKIIKKHGSIVYEKHPLAQDIPLSYFQDTVKGQKKISVDGPRHKKNRNSLYSPLNFPTENEILDIAREGENQLYEFKRAGAEPKDITKEAAAFSVTKKGGLIFYGIEDDGKITGTDLSRQQLDQRINNSIKSSMDPIIIVDIKSTKVTGTEVILVRVPPWNRKDVYQYQGRTYIRMGQNSLPANSSIVKKLHRGEYVT